MSHHPTSEYQYITQKFNSQSNSQTCSPLIEQLKDPHHKLKQRQTAECHN